MPYQRVEPSNPIYTRDNLHVLTFLSNALGMRGTMSVYIPEGCEKSPSLPMVLLLHGVYGNHWSWAYMGGAHLRAQGLIDAGEIQPMGIIMPSDGLYGEGSGYVSHPGRDCENWIVEDVVGCAREYYGCFSEDSPLFITGFSMGGFGSLRLGGKDADRFRSISGHASVTRYDQLPIFIDGRSPTESYLTESDLSAVYWMKANKAILPPLRFDCGREDKLFQFNNELHDELEKEGITHDYEVLEGGHSWQYCHEHLARSLKFFDRILRG